MRAVLLAGLMAASATAAAAEPAEWLARMSQAARETNYQGVVVYRGDEVLETFRVTHRFQNGLEQERVQSLNGEPREVSKQGDKMTCLLPKARRLSASQQPTPKGLFPGLTPERLKQLTQVYVLDDLGTVRIAGRVCRGVAITPRDQYRYGYEVWADEATAVPLKVNLIGRQGITLEQMMFTEVDFPTAIPDTAFAVEAEAPAAAPPAQAAAQALPATGAQPFARLPPGFRVTLREQRPRKDGQGQVDHWILSDGISAISVFATHRQEAAPRRVFQGESQMGAVSAYGRSMGTMQITVVGEVPRQTVRMVGDAIKMPEPATPVAAPQP